MITKTEKLKPNMIDILGFNKIILQEKLAY